MFHTEVLYLSTLKHLWVDRKEPVPLYLDPNAEVLNEGIKDVTLKHPNPPPALIPDQRVWDLHESVKVFLETAKKLRESGNLEKWDKDNIDHLNFVTAASNIRAAVFHLEFSSRFFVKEKAGSIIPAIATTNAIVAGLIVMKAFRVLAGNIDKCRNTWLKKQPTRGMLFVGSTLDPPNRKCYVCGDNFVTVKINTETTKFGYFVEEVVKKEWDIQQPIITVGTGTVLFDYDDDDEEAVKMTFDKYLKDFYMPSGSVVYVEDLNVSLKVSVVIQHGESKETDEKQHSITGGKVELEVASTAVETKEDDGDCCEIVQDPNEIAVLSTQQPEQNRKRKRDEEEEEDKESKKQKTGH